MSTKGFFSGEYRVLLALLLAVVVAGVVFFSASSPPTGLLPQQQVQGLAVNIVGSGTVKDDLGKLNCVFPLVCNGNYAPGAVVTLTATPATGYSFSGWSLSSTIFGGSLPLTCPATSTTCTLTMDKAYAITAKFVSGTGGTGGTTQPTLTVAKAGTGKGTVTSDKGSINCGASCSASYTDGTIVILTASADTGSEFKGWAGAIGCTIITACKVPLLTSKTVTATFTATSGGQPCLTVITPAYNPTTKECKDFSSSCLDQGWLAGACPYAPTNQPPVIDSFTAVANQVGDLTEVIATGDTTVLFDALATDKDTPELSFVLYYDTSTPNPSFWPKVSGKFLGVAPMSVGNYNYKAPTSGAVPITYFARLEVTDGTDTVKKDMKIIISPVVQQKLPVTLNLNKNWNLITFLGGFSSAKTSCPSVTFDKTYDTPLVYFWYADQGAYSSLKTLNGVLNNAADKQTALATSFWAYVPGACKIDFYDVTPVSGAGMKIFAGWNFIPVRADMAAVPGGLDALGPDCGFRAVYAFNSAAQEWDQSITLDGSLEGYVDRGILVYADNACTLRSLVPV